MKKTLSLILSLCMVLTVVGNIPMTVSAAPRLTLSEALQWLDNQIDTNIDYDKVEGYQCVDLIKAYYGQLATWVATGNAIDYANPSKEYIYKDYGWTMYSNMYQTEDVKSVSATTPRPGDIIVFNWKEPYSGEWLGHIGIVYAETKNNTVYYVDQNGDGRGAVCTKRSQPLSEVYGIIRPDFDVEGEEQECTSHNYVNGTCSNCGATCSHTYVDSFCTKCGNPCSHSYGEGTCVICGAKCLEHSYLNGACIYCNTKCTNHTFLGGACSKCGVSCSHSYVHGVCSICYMTCEHTYVNNTCTNCGVICSDHTFVNGVCSICNAKIGIRIQNDELRQYYTRTVYIDNGIPGMRIESSNDDIWFSKSNIIKYNNKTYAVNINPQGYGTTNIIITDSNDNVLYTSEDIIVLMGEKYFGLNLDGTVNYDEIKQITDQAGNSTVEIALDDYFGISAEAYNAIAKLRPEEIVFKNSCDGWTITLSRGDYTTINVTGLIDIDLDFGNNNPNTDETLYILANGTTLCEPLYINCYLAESLTSICDRPTISLDHENSELAIWLKNNNTNSITVFSCGKVIYENLSKDNITFKLNSSQLKDLFIADTSNATYYLSLSKYKNSSHVVLDGYSGTLPEVLEIPSEVAGCPVTTIGNSAFKNAKTLKKVIMPNSIVDMQGETFYGCENLEEVVLSENLESMGGREFGKTNIKHIKIPAKVKYNLNNTFNEVELDTIEVDENNTVFKSEGNCLIQIFNLGDEQRQELVKGTNNSVIPEGVTYIRPFAFEGCTKLKEIDIPKSVTSIGRNPFIGCVKLEKITVDEENEYFHSDGNCLIATEENAVLAGTANSVIPEYIVSIEDRAFYNISNLTEIILPDGLGNIGEQAFAGTGIETITIPGSVYFWEWAWYGAPLEECKNLTEIIFEYGIEEISFEIFNGITSLRTITIPNSVTFIGYYTFENYDNLETVYFIGTEEEWNKITIGDGNESLFKANIIFVCEHTFADNVCSKCGATLEISTDGRFNGVDTTVTGDIKVPLASNGVSVSTIGAGAFKNCASLSSVMVYDNVTEIADDAFEGVSDNFVIKCYEDSPISVWAEEKGVAYEIVPVPYGNVNADEATDIFDLIALAKHTVGNSDAIDTRAANTNASDKADRNIDIFDLIALAKHICNPEFTLGPKA